MCGFFVVKMKKNTTDAINKQKFINCTKMMRHRGPDDLKFYYDRNIYIGFNRLSIIDLSYKGSQPFQDQKSNQILVFNGHITNSELLKKNINKNKIFKGHSDTEVLYKLIDSHHNKVLNLIEGMFSFISYDKKKNNLFIARDQFGIKPLYYFEDKNYFVFSSEIKPILKFINKNKISDDAVVNFFFHGSQDHDDKTFFQDIKIFKSGHYMNINNNKISNYSDYFSIFDKKQNYDDSSLVQNIYKEKFSNLITKYLHSDTKCASFLSSGVDSSYISKLVSQKVDYKTETFTYGFKGYYSEDKSAKKFAKFYNLKSNVETLSPEDVINNFEKVLYKTESPITSLRLIAVDKLYALVNKLGYKVILEGTGGDEALGGYKYNYLYYLKDKFNLNLNKISNYIIGESLKSKNLSQKVLSNILTLTHQGGSTTDGTPFVYSDLFNFDFLNNSIDEKSYFTKNKSYYKYLNNLQKSQYKDIYHIKLPKILNFSDKIAMSYSVETRFPYLDPDFFKFCFNLRNDYKFKKNESRWPAKQFFENEVSNFVNFKSKKTIVDPQSQWLRTYLYEFLYDNLNSKNFRNLKYFNQQNIIKHIENFKKRNIPTSYNIFQILSFFLFFKKFNNLSNE